MAALKKSLVIFGCCILMTCASSKQPETTTSLENTDWVLTEYDGKAYEPTGESKPVHLKLQSANHSVSGFGGCNTFSGSYTHAANTLQFTLVSTKMFCRDNMEVEDYLFKTLVQVEYHVEGENLIIMNGDGKVLKFTQR